MQGLGAEESEERGNSGLLCFLGSLPSSGVVNKGLIQLDCREAGM